MGSQNRKPLGLQVISLLKLGLCCPEGTAREGKAAWGVIIPGTDSPTELQCDGKSAVQYWHGDVRSDMQSQTGFP